MPAADATAPSDAPPKKGKRWLVPLIALLLGGAGAASVTMSDSIRQTFGIATAEAATDADEPIEFGEFKELPAIVVNPRGTGGRRYLMLQVGVEAEEPKTLERLDALGPAVTDAVIGLMGEKNVAELGDVTKRDSIKATVRTSINEILGDDEGITRVYFTQYVLQ